MPKQRFKIIPFFNPSGDKVFRVSGTLNGKSVRKNFKTRSEAVAEREKLDVEYVNSKNDGQTVWTTLSHDENREAIAAVNLLKKSGSSKGLLFAVKYMLSNYSEEGELIKDSTAVDDYLASREEDMQKKIITKIQFTRMKGELKKFKAFFHDTILSDLSAERIQTYLNGDDTGKKQSLKTWNNRRAYLSTFFKFCLFKRYLINNPILAVPNYKIKNARGTAATLTAENAEELMRLLENFRGNPDKRGRYLGVEGCLVPFFALTLFAGIRPDYRIGEISRIKREHILFDTNVILIEPEVSKVNEKRTIKMQPNLRAWLEKYPIERYPILPKHVGTLLDVLRKTYTLPHDVMRHTFISMTVGAFRSVGDASLQAGNSEAIIRKHYLDLKSTEESDAFWRIVPKGVKLPELEKKDGWFVENKKAAALSK